MDSFMDQFSQKYNAGEMIRANSEAEARQMQNLEEQVEAYEAVLQEMRKLNYRNSELTEKMYALVDEGIDKVRNLQLVADTGEVAPDVISGEMANVVSEVQFYAEAMQKSSEDVKNTVAVLQAGNEDVKNTVSLLQADNADVRSSVAALQAGNAEMCSSVAALQAGNEEVKASTDEVKAAIVALQAALDEMSQTTNAVRFDIQTDKNSSLEMNSQLQASMEQLLNNTSALQYSLQQMMETQSALSSKEPEAATVTESEEMKAAMAELKDAGSATRSSVESLSATSNEIKIGIANLKNSNEETRNTLQSSFDAAIYGLKQDNREIVEFIQRINAKMNSKDEDLEKQQKEAEARAREEEQRKLMEERFKSAEEFMHKESVKVYRNVQAVIAENGEKQFDGIELQIKRAGAKATGAKVWAIIATIMALSGVAIQILQILGII